MDRFWRVLFPSSDDPLQQRIRLMGGLMVGITLSTTLTGALIEVPTLWRDGGPISLASALVPRLAACVALSGLSVLPFVVGAHVAARTGRTQLLFSACLVLFFVGLALRAFLFFDYAQARTRGEPGAGEALAALIGEPLASAAVLGLLWATLRSG